MAINIKEILHPSDSDTIKFEKINYNFDQIVANGGGPVGPTGTKGAQGEQGDTGLKGEKGDTGAKGDVGATGITDSPWAGVEHDNGVSVILKTKKSLDPDEDGTPTAYSTPAAIWLGDPDFEEGVDPGDTSTTARITVAISAGVFDQYFKMQHTSNKRMNLDSVTDGAYTEFRVVKELGDTNIAYKIDTDRITLVANNDQLLLRGNVVKIKPLGNSNVTFETDGTGIVDVDMPATFQDYVDFNSTGATKLPVGTDLQRPTGVTGMIRFNSEAGLFEGFNGTMWRNIGTLEDADGDTYITVEETADEDVIRMYFGGTEGLTVGETYSDGVSNLTGTVYTERNIVTDGSIMPKTSGKGLMFPTKPHAIGGQLQAANYTSTQDRRTIHDYFYRSSIIMESATNDCSNTPFATNSQGTTNTTSINTSHNKISDDLFYIHKTYNANEGGSLVINKAPIAMVINTTNSRLTYTKVGHQVTAWGKLQFWPFPVGASQYSPDALTYNLQGAQMGTSSGNTAAKTARVMIFPAEAAVWPYKNASSEKVIFPITINMDVTFGGATTPNSYDGTSGVTSSDNEYYGVIFPGMAGFNIVKILPATMNIESYNNNTVPNATAAGATQPIQNANSPYAKFLTLQDFEAAFVSAKDVTLEFNFTMATNINSYDPIIESNTRAMYTIGSPLSSQ